MALNIKNEETYELVKELAALKGVSLTTAVKLATQAELEREKVERERVKGTGKSRYDLLMEFADLCSERIKDPIHSWEIDSLLYDEDGLPK